jgi:hypothetical protein
MKKKTKIVKQGWNVDGWPMANVIDHEHKYWPNSRQRSDTCLICGFDPHFEKYENKK